MSRMSILELGAHRGGLSVFEATRRARPPERVTLVDPKPGRATALAQRYREVGIAADGMEDRGELIIHRSDPQAVILQSSDDLTSMAEVLATAPDRTVLSQGVLRGLQSTEFAPPVIGVTMTALPGRSRTAQVDLLRALARIAPAQSSAVFRSGELDSGRLAVTRRAISQASVARVQDLPRARDAEHLTQLWWGDEHFDLVTISSTEGDLRLRTAHAEAASRGRAHMAIAMMTASSRVEVFVFERFGSRSGVRLYVDVQRALSGPGSRPWLRPAAFTD